MFVASFWAGNANAVLPYTKGRVPDALVITLNFLPNEYEIVIIGHFNVLRYSIEEKEFGILSELSTVILEEYIDAVSDNGKLIKYYAKDRIYTMAGIERDDKCLTCYTLISKFRYKIGKSVGDDLKKYPHAPPYVRVTALGDGRHKACIRGRTKEDVRIAKKYRIIDFEKHGRTNFVGKFGFNVDTKKFDIIGIDDGGLGLSAPKKGAGRFSVQVGKQKYPDEKGRYGKIIRKDTHFKDICVTIREKK